MGARSRFDPLGRRQGRTLGAMSAGTQGGTVRGTPSPTPTREPKKWQVAQTGFPLFSADFVRAFWASISDTTVTWINGFFSTLDGSQIRSDVEEFAVDLYAWIKGMNQPSFWVHASPDYSILNVAFLDGVVNFGASIQATDSGATISLGGDGATVNQNNVSLGTDGLQLSEFNHHTPTAVGNTAIVYARDNGSGKTQLVAQFPTGAVVVLATEP